MDIYTLQSSRRTIRKFKDQAIDYSLLERFVDCARLSSSVMNLQPIRYYIAYENNIVDAVFPYTKWAGYLKGAHSPNFEERPRAYILFLYDESVSKNPKWDVGAVSHAIQLMALEEGIGTCWLGSVNRKEVLNICKIDKKYSLDSVLALGYPAEEPIAEDAAEGGIQYYLDENKRLHVPKRSLQEVLINKK